MNESYLQLGAVAVIFLFCAREFFIYLKVKKTPFNGTSKAILNELQSQNENHLIHLQASIEKLNDTVRDGNTQIISLLSEIKGVLSK